MKRACCVVLAGLLGTVAGHAQGDGRYGSLNTFSVFANYSNDSSHMFIGQEENRKIGGFGAGYSRRLVHKRSYDFRYEADLLPVTFIRDPVVSGVSTVIVVGNVAGVVVPASGPFSGPTQADCASGTTVVQGSAAHGVTYTQTVVQQCGERWTYAGGISPLGVRFSFATRRKLQPYLVANAGFLMATRDLPVNDSARMNFTFEGGGGLEWFRDRRRSFMFDYRVHHLSNAYHGLYNPGIDSGVFRVGYRFGR
jgi:hypothetical protein